jgi:hypothetical protein
VSIGSKEGRVPKTIRKTIMGAKLGMQLVQCSRETGVGSLKGGKHRERSERIEKKKYNFISMTCGAYCPTKMRWQMLMMAQPSAMSSERVEESGQTYFKWLW